MECAPDNHFFLILWRESTAGTIPLKRFVQVLMALFLINELLSWLCSGYGIDIDHFHLN